ncbi:sensor histidine kinase [Phytomonospora endophytica]|uniref:histidine kinase n=1 Tax=Phytomonospora endophytica TaxID=714109 RepID=A0A841FCZ9_9ACTN|nr:sensor histidine kinase [Phytomonospora endophytica]MBB6033295.1 signal transduction histidine kinase [Phytomonospora endophytica]GIG65522.1 two-component sensor histidine kinase [Phytomonospora endophytica]
MNPARIARDLAQRHPRLADAAVVAGVYAGLLLAMRFGKFPPTPPLAAVFGAPMAASLFFRRKYPIAVLAACLLCLVAFLIGSDRQRAPIELICAFALYNVALRTPRRTAWTAAAVTCATLLVANLISTVDQPFLSDLLGPVLTVGMATGIGDARRSRRAYIAAVEERARQAEATREEEAERRVMAERLRIARELHDVLAHHIALINVQAQVAAHVLDTEPAQARTALGHVSDAGREALDELRTTVGLLRAPGSGEDLPTAPSPGLDGLPGLLASFAAVGMDVAHLTQGTPRPLSAQVALAAYRIAQEALTNVHKHAPGANAALTIAYVPGDVLVEITDDGPGGATLGAGNGLIGMRERALSVGGTFSAGPGPGGGFRVRAVLPAAGEPS